MGIIVALTIVIMAQDPMKLSNKINGQKAPKTLSWRGLLKTISTHFKFLKETQSCEAIFYCLFAFIGIRTSLLLSRN
jgi:hypothetical protein